MTRRTSRPAHTTLREPQRTSYRALGDALGKLSDPLSDVLALVTEQQFSAMLERSSRKARTVVLQDLRTPAVGHTSRHAVRQALGALHRSDTVKQTRVIGVLTQPTFDVMRQHLQAWLDGGAEQELERLQELAGERTVLLLAGLTHWTFDPVGVPLLRLVLQEHSLSSWPSHINDEIVRACRAYEEDCREQRRVESTDAAAFLATLIRSSNLRTGRPTGARSPRANRMVLTG